MFDSYCQFEKAKADWILACADEFKDDLIWKGLDLRPSFIRYLWIALGSVEKNWLENKLISNTNSHDLFLQLREVRESWKTRVGSISGIAYLRTKARWIGYRLDKCTKQRPLIAVHHWKFVNYLKRSEVFDGLDPVWLVDSPKMSKAIGLLEGDTVVPHLRPFRKSKQSYPFSVLHDLANGLEASLLRANPSAVFVVEGDAPYHTLLAEIGRKLKIPVYCFQWGIFHRNKLRTAFSDMRFTKLLVWGKIFEEQLKSVNQELDYIRFGHPLLERQIRSGRDIIFLSQGVGQYIEKKDQLFLINLAVSLAKKFPRRVTWRPHPNIPLESIELATLKEGGVLLLDPRLSLSQQLQESMIAIGIGSSSLIDALAFGVIPISFNTTCLSDFPFPLVERNIGFEYRNFDVALEEIVQLLNDESRIRTVQKNIEVNASFMFERKEKNVRQKLIRSMCMEKG